MRFHEHYNSFNDGGFFLSLLFWWLIVWVLFAAFGRRSLYRNNGRLFDYAANNARLDARIDARIAADKATAAEPEVDLTK